MKNIVQIDNSTIGEIKKIASQYKLLVEIVTDPKAKFQEEVFRNKGIVVLTIGGILAYNE